MRDKCANLDIRGAQTLLCSPRSGSGCAVGLEALEALEALEGLEALEALEKLEFLEKLVLRETEPRLSGRAKKGL